MDESSRNESGPQRDAGIGPAARRSMGYGIEGAGAEATAIQCIQVRRLPMPPRQIWGLSVALKLTWLLGVAP